MNKASITAFLFALAVSVSFLAGVTLLMSRVYARMIDDGEVPLDWQADGGVREQLARGIKSSSDGKWKPTLKRVWLAFILVDLLAIIVVLIV